jgi:hypothetical protein
MHAHQLVPGGAGGEFSVLISTHPFSVVLKDTGKGWSKEYKVT